METTKEIIRRRINRIAETHYFLRPILVNALKNQFITEEGKKYVGEASTYYDYWTTSFSDKFYDMGTLIRLGTEIENSLKHYYMDKKGYLNLLELKSDSNYVDNIFQRIMPWTQNNVLDLYKNQLSIDLSNNSKLKNIQELMLSRHLYAHSSGLLNDDFINKYQRLTNIDISTLTHIATSYPVNDTYYFDPLNKLNDFIEDSRSFIEQLP